MGYSLSDRAILSRTRGTPKPIDASRACTHSRAYKVAPIAVPSVFVMMSVTPEARVGRNDCNTSIAKLTTAPKTIAASTGRSRKRDADKYAQKQNPRGTLLQRRFLTAHWLQ